MATPASEESFLQQQIAAAYRDACAVELSALKPGNVHRYAGGHGMSVDDFIVSATVSAEPLTAPGLSLGERIFRAVEASRAAAGCNTNLGILLLCAPLIHGALERGASGGLRERLMQSLRRADSCDTAWVFRAIELAAPGGLGTAARYDVRGPANAPLMQVMAYAANWDLIARQYATSFADLFARAVPLLRRMREQWQDEAWAATAIFMDFLSRFPDTHIVRKHGVEKAEEISRRAFATARDFFGSASPEDFRERLLKMDREFKQEGINPGTSADLTVASLLIRRLEPRCAGIERTAGAPRVRGLPTVKSGAG